VPISLIEATKGIDVAQERRDGLSRARHLRADDRMVRIQRAAGGQLALAYARPAAMFVSGPLGGRL